MITKTTEMAEDTYNISLITYFEFAFYIAELLILMFCDREEATECNSTLGYEDPIIYEIFE